MHPLIISMLGMLGILLVLSQGSMTRQTFITFNRIITPSATSITNHSDHKPLLSTATIFHRRMRSIKPTTLHLYHHDNAETNHRRLLRICQRRTIPGHHWILLANPTRTSRPRVSCLDRLNNRSRAATHDLQLRQPPQLCLLQRS